jgi:hypothetical protein
MQGKEVLIREISPEVARAELMLKLPQIEKAVEQLRKAQKVDQDTMNIEFVV